MNTLVLLDPTADDGESALDLLHRGDTHVSLLVLLTGPASAALSTYARAEGLDLATAGWNYLDQVAARIASPGRVVEQIIATGPETAFEVASVVAHHGVDRVLLPSSTADREPATVRRLCDALPEVTVAEAEAIRKAS